MLRSGIVRGRLASRPLSFQNPVIRIYMIYYAIRAMNPNEMPNITFALRLFWMNIFLVMIVVSQSEWVLGQCCDVTKSSLSKQGVKKETGVRCNDDYIFKKLINIVLQVSTQLQIDNTLTQYLKNRVLTQGYQKIFIVLCDAAPFQLNFPTLFNPKVQENFHVI